MEWQRTPAIPPLWTNSKSGTNHTAEKIRANFVGGENHRIRADCRKREDASIEIRPHHLNTSSTSTKDEITSGKTKIIEKRITGTWGGRKGINEPRNKKQNKPPWGDKKAEKSQPNKAPNQGECLQDGGGRGLGVRDCHWVAGPLPLFFLRNS